MKNVALIPARGGSKGIPRKNLVELAGKPLLYYAVTAATESAVDETWVTSDDDEILEVAQRLGARSIRRPACLATDTASTESVMLHFAEHVDFDNIILVQATCPLTLAADINAVIGMLGDYDSILSVAEFTQYIWTNGVPDYDPAKRPRRQDRPPTFLETGALFATSRLLLKKTGIRISGHLGFLVVPKARSFDVDSYEDLELVRKLMS